MSFKDWLFQYALHGTALEDCTEIVVSLGWDEESCDELYFKTFFIVQLNWKAGH